MLLGNAFTARILNPSPRAHPVHPREVEEEIGKGGRGWYGSHWKVFSDWTRQRTASLSQTRSMNRHIDPKIIDSISIAFYVKTIRYIYHLVTVEIEEVYSWDEENRNRSPCSQRYKISAVNHHLLNIQLIQITGAQLKVVFPHHLVMLFSSLSYDGVLLCSCHCGSTESQWK